jgi:hypothetical protein
MLSLSPNLIFLGGSIWPQRGLTQEDEGTNVGARVHHSTPSAWLARELEPNRKTPEVSPVHLSSILLRVFAGGCLFTVAAKCCTLNSVTACIIVLVAP